MNIEFDSEEIPQKYDINHVDKIENRSFSCQAVVNPPLSHVFIDFLSRWIDGGSFDREHWSNQTHEVLNSDSMPRRSANVRLDRLTLSREAKIIIGNVYDRFSDLCSGKSEILKELHRRFKFLVVVGIPRNGGSYLTAELFSALGHDPEEVPSAIAHDGFPEAAPFSYQQDSIGWIRFLMSVSEYMTILDLFFREDVKECQIVVPKKLTKAVYAGGFFNTILGPSAEYLITVRNPIDCCVSTYELSGGLPENGQFAIRSAIERWVERDIIKTWPGKDEELPKEYFSSYVRYWELYHMNLATCGLLAQRNYKIVPYSAATMTETANHFHERFGSGREASRFLEVKDDLNKHKDWYERAKVALDRVASVWDFAGLVLPKSILEQRFSTLG